MFMFASEKQRLYERIARLEKENSELRRRTGVYVDRNGLLQGWDGDAQVSIVDAVRALAVASGHKWKLQPPEPADLEAVK